MTTHKQVNVSGIDVDEKLADLLSMLWEAGIQTQYSCQGGGPDPDIHAMIVFPTVTDALRFMQETFAVTGYWNYYADRMVFTLACPSELVSGPVRAVVRWDARFTPAWAAAWNGTPLALDDFLELAEPGFKAEQARLDAEEVSA